MSREFGDDESRRVRVRSALAARAPAHARRRPRGRDRRGGRKALLASFDAGVPAIAAPASLTTPATAPCRR